MVTRGTVTNFVSDLTRPDSMITSLTRQPLRLSTVFILNMLNKFEVEPFIHTRFLRIFLPYLKASSFYETYLVLLIQVSKPRNLLGKVDHILYGFVQQALKGVPAHFSTLQGPPIQTLKVQNLSNISIKLQCGKPRTTTTFRISCLTFSSDTLNTSKYNKHSNIRPF